MKDYSVLESDINFCKMGINAAYDKGYKHGFQDGIEFEEHQKLKLKLEKAHEYYQKGLDDAWEAVRKMADMDGNTFNEIFGSWLCWTNIFSHESASECLQKIRDYEEKQNAEVKVGDEVIYHGAPHDGDIGVVIGSKDDWREVRFLSSWSSVAVSKDTLTKTGRHFPEIEQVLEAMKE